MDWTQTKNIAEANLDTIVAKASNPKVALTALEQKITAEVGKVEAHLLTLDERVMALPALLDEADKLVIKVDAVIAKAKAEGRADLAAAAGQRRQKHLAERAALENELNSVEQVENDANEWLSKLQDKLAEVEARIRVTPDKAPAVKAAPAAPQPAAPAAATASKPAAAPTPKPPTAKPAAGGKKDALDDEFASLLSELDVDLSKVELPKRKLPAKLPDSDDGIPDLVTVAEDELPEGEELPPLEQPKGKGAPPKGAPAPAAGKGAPSPAKVAPTSGKPAVGPAKAPVAAKAGTAPVPAKAGVAPAPAGAPEDKKKSKLWLWITLGAVGVGGAGAAVAHFVLGLF